MTQEENELLLKDLCERLPYGVKCHFKYGSAEGDVTLGCIDNGIARFEYGWYGKFHVSIDADYIKPYLRSMSSMTEEEKKNLLVTIVGDDGIKYFQVLSDGSIDNTDATIQDLNKFNMHWVSFDKDTVTLYLDWLNAHHFDYRGLIDKGLALEALEGMYN